MWWCIPIVNGCTGNGCGGSVCCPGPVNSQVLFGTSGTGLPDTFTQGNKCSCPDSPEPLFDNIRLIETNTTGCASGFKRHIWEFYCIGVV